LTRFVRLGGVLVVDDSNPAVGAFGRGARRELSRVLPESAPVRLDPSHVVFKTFYIVDRPVGRVLGPPELEAIVRGKSAQVLFLQHDLLGALARSGEGFAFETEPGGAEQREHAIRLAVNNRDVRSVLGLQGRPSPCSVFDAASRATETMTLASLALAEGVPLATALAVLGFALVSLTVLGFELRRREGAAHWVLLSGIVALGLVAGAILRPARVMTRGVRVGAKVVVLVSTSPGRLLLPSDGRTRRELALEAARATAKHFASARVSVFGFGGSDLRPLIIDEALAHTSARELSDETDLTGALAVLGQEPGERAKGDRRGQRRPAFAPRLKSWTKPRCERCRVP